MFSSILVLLLLVPIVLGWFLVLFPLLLFVFLPALVGLYFVNKVLIGLFLPLLNTCQLVNDALTIDDGSPVVQFDLRFPQLHTGSILGREKIGEMLMLAQNNLGAGYRLKVTGCLLPYDADINCSENSSKRYDQYSHQTGGACHVTLADSAGNELNLGLRIEKKLNWLGRIVQPKISREVQNNRNILSMSLLKAGFVNNPLEWWHWSYGDRYWSVVSRSPHAIYGSVGRDFLGKISA